MATAPQLSVGYRAARAVLEPFGLAGDYCLLVDGQPEPIGRSRAQLRTELHEADFLLNIMGFLDDPELCDDARRRVFVDIDPGFPQMWADLGLADVLSGHDVYLTVGANVGGDDCLVPTLDLLWRPTLPPVVLEQWPVQAGAGRAITTVGTWRGPFDPVDYDGTRYGLRAHELRSFAGLAAQIDWPVEMALDIDPADAADADHLWAGGWRLVDPVGVAGTPDQYRRYVQTSTAELMAAKGMYVQTASGWFSDRSACYLASGRPVVAQDTGLGCSLPTGNGLLVFTDADEAQAAMTDVLTRYEHHADAARSIAEDHLDSDHVLAALLDTVLAPA
jgi:glycosyltransferase involved in cell wall biosynthesis